MKRSRAYYRRVFNTLVRDEHDRPLRDKDFDQVMGEANGVALIDELSDRFKRAMGLQSEVASVGESTANQDTDMSIAGINFRDDEEHSVSEQNNINSSTGDARASDAKTGTALQPGEIPTSSAVEPSLPVITSRTENLPNGRSGQPYDVSLDELLGDLPSQLHLENDAGSGLSLTADRRLRGTPSLTGSLQLAVVGFDDEGIPALQLQLRLALIPSSRDLWKNNLSDPDALYAKADEEIDRLPIGDGWHMVMGSQRGRSHAHRGGQRDDHGVIARAASGWNVLIVGDGAGSCEFSRQGSLLATTVARDSLLGSLDGNDGVSLETAVLAWFEGDDHSRMPQELLVPLQSTVITAVHAGHRAISQEAAASGHSIKAFSTTLLLAIHKETPRGHIVVTFGIGDGAIGALTSGRQAQMLNTADSGQHAGQTRFLDAPLFQESQGLYRRVTVKLYETLDALVLATDGVTDPKFSSDNDMHDAESWWSLYDELAPALVKPDKKTDLDPLLDYLNFFVERHHDDRTLAVLYRDVSLSEQSVSEVPK